MFSEPTLARLAKAADDDGGVTTVDARRILGFTEQRWRRLRACDGFPDLAHIGVNYFVDVAALVDFMRARNEAERGITLTQVARLTRHTLKTLRALIARGQFVPLVGVVRGQPRFARDAVDDWARARRRAGAGRGANTTRSVRGAGA